MAASNDMLGQVKEKIGRLSLHLEDESYVDFVEERFDKKRSQLKEEYEEAEDEDLKEAFEKLLEHHAVRTEFE